MLACRLANGWPYVARQLNRQAAHHAFFARAGFTDAARAEAESVEAQLVDLESLDLNLRQTL